MTSERVEQARMAVFDRARYLDRGLLVTGDESFTGQVNELIAAVRADEAAKYAALVKAAHVASDNYGSLTGARVLAAALRALDNTPNV